MKNFVEDEQTKDKFTAEQKEYITKHADELIDVVKTKDLQKVEELQKSLEKYVQDISSKLYENQQPQPEQSTSENKSSEHPDAEDVTFEEVK